MEIIRILLITLLAAVGGGCVIGIFWAKHVVKKATSDRPPLLSIRERIVYAGLLVAGATCILIGIFLIPANSNDLIGAEGDMMYPGFEGELADAYGGEMDMFDEGFHEDDLDEVGEAGEENGSDPDIENNENPEAEEAGSQELDSEADNQDGEQDTALPEADPPAEPSQPAAAAPSADSGGTRIVTGTDEVVVIEVR